jgi:hypothetical protein
MSDGINMYILIGGKIKYDKIHILSKMILNNCMGMNVEVDGNKTIVTKVEDILSKRNINKPLRLDYMSQFGLCDDVKSICKECKLSYLHFCEAKDEFDASIFFWKPGMGKERFSYSSQSGVPLVEVDKIKGHLELMYYTMTMGIDKVLKTDEYKKFNCVKKHKTSKASFSDQLRRDLSKMLFVEPYIPPFEVL